MAYGNGVFVITGFYNTNTVGYSTNGATWTGCGVLFSPTSGGVAYGPASGLAASGNVFIMCGPKTNSQTASGTAGNTTLAYSTNGITWTGILSPSAQSVFTGNGMGQLIFNLALNIWMFTGNNNNYNAALIGYSKDGTTWTKLNPTVINGAGNGYGLAYNPNSGLTVVCGYMANQTAISTDGVNWTNGANPYPGGYPTSVACGGAGYNMYMTVGGGTGTYSIYYSTNGYTWTGSLTMAASTSVGNKIWYSRAFDTWYMVGGIYTYTSSNDGSTWTAITPGNITSVWSTT
jgi:hypothetical protein